MTELSPKMYQISSYVNERQTTVEDQMPRMNFCRHSEQQHGKTYLELYFCGELLSS